MSDIDIPRGGSTPRGRRRRYARLGRRALLGLKLAALAALPVALWLLVGRARHTLDGMNLFALQDLRITGVSCGDAQALSDALDPMLGRPLASLEPADVEHALAVDPWIIDGRLRRLWPNRAELRVEERHPAALVALSDGIRCLSEDGRVLPLPKTRTLDLPLITSPGAFPVAQAPAMASLILRLRTLSPEVFSRLDQLSWRDDPRLRLRGAPVTIVLERENLEHGLSLLESVIRERPALLQDRGEMDLRFTNQVILRRNDV
jgi:cell division septal protein FtsQ